MDGSIVTKHQTINMKEFEKPGGRKIVKGRQARKFTPPVVNDLSFVEGHEDEFIGHLQKLTGWSRDEIEKIVRESH
jgi:hypothetical protein